MQSKQRPQFSECSDIDELGEKLERIGEIGEKTKSWSTAHLK